MINYPVGDFLIRIKNAAMVGKREVSTGKTKLVLAVAKKLKSEGFLESVKEAKGVITVQLAIRKKEPVLIDVKLVSKPGLREYMGVGDLKNKRGISILILSTPKGILSSKEALKKGLGGEVIAEIY